MFGRAMSFLILATIGLVFCFAALARAVAKMGRILFVVALAVLVLSQVSGRRSREA